MSRVLTVDGSVKIGAKVYGVEITNKLDLGNVNYSGEISYTDLVIRICPNAQAKMEADFLHEIVSHILDGTLLSWLARWRMKSQMLVEFLLENEKARLSEKD
jgi:hypothetical protein